MGEAANSEGPGATRAKVRSRRLATNGRGQFTLAPFSSRTPGERGGRLRLRVGGCRGGWSRDRAGSERGRGNPVNRRWSGSGAAEEKQARRQTGRQKHKGRKRVRGGAQKAESVFVGGERRVRQSRQTCGGQAPEGSLRARRPGLLQLSPSTHADARTARTRSSTTSSRRRRLSQIILPAAAWGQARRLAYIRASVAVSRQHSKHEKSRAHLQRVVSEAAPPPLSPTGTKASIHPPIIHYLSYCSVPSPSPCRLVLVLPMPETCNAPFPSAHLLCSKTPSLINETKRKNMLILEREPPPRRARFSARRPGQWRQWRESSAVLTLGRQRRDWKVAGVNDPLYVLRPDR